jgi:hypothetical protein
MAKSREEVQDIALYHIDKLNKKHPGARKDVEPTLSEQIKALDEWEKKTPSEKLSATPYKEWLENMRMYFIKGKKHTFTQRFWNWVDKKHRSELEDFHKKGISYNEMSAWLEDRVIDHMNH